ncbi:MAG: CvpA family protein [Albidovulum sp.]
MEGFTLVDAGVVVVVLLSAILAYSRGFVREVFAILGWVAAAALAFTFAKQAEPLIKQIPVLDKFLGTSCELSIIAAFAVVFAGSLILVSIITPLFASVIQRSALSGIDQGLGFLFGVARGILLIAVAFVLFSRLVTPNSVPMVDNSRAAEVFASFQSKLNDQMPEDAPGWVAARYNELVGECGAPTSVTPQEPAAVEGENATGAKTVTP